MSARDVINEELRLADRYRLFERCRDQVQHGWENAPKVAVRTDTGMKPEERLMFIRELIICGENLQPFPRQQDFVEPFRVRVLADWQINKLLEYEQMICSTDIKQGEERTEG